MPSQHREFYVRVVALSLVVAALLVPLGFWANGLDIDPGLVPVYDREGRTFWILGGLLAVASGIAHQWLEQHQQAFMAARDRDVRTGTFSEMPTAWILPLVTTLGFVMLLGVYQSNSAILAIALGCFLTLVVGAVSRYHLIDLEEASREWARGLYTIAIHIVAFIVLSMVYINKLRSLFSATAILILGFLLLLQLIEGEDALFARRLVYALIGGVALGQITWVLNYWKATGWTGGAALLIFFYLAGGLILSQLRRGTQVRDLVEYGGVALAAFAIVVYSVFR